MKRRKSTSCPCPERRGATLVEFAVVSPVFFLMMFASIEFAHIQTIRNTANNAAYEAARMVVVPGANANEAIAEATRIMSAVGTRQMNVTVTPPVITSATTSVTVEVDVPYAQNSLFVPWFTGAVTVHSESTLRTERYSFPVTP